jgi:hypothetical protein
MATEDIVGGLFGINPDMYRQQQQQQVFNRAVALQNLDPFQQAAVGYQQAGYNLAGALGGALGGVDPQLQRISALNAISKQIDQTNPESMLQGAKMLADAGFMQEALGLAQYARKANSEIALAQQRMRADKAAAPDSPYAKINPSDYTPESVKAFAASGNYGDLVPKAGKADKLVSPVNPSDYTPASIAAFNVSGNYADLVLKPSKADKPDKLIGNVNPESYTPASVAAFSKSGNYDDLVLKPEKAKDSKNIANVNPNDFTPASLAKFSDSGNYADLELKPEKPSAADKPNIKEIGVSAKGDAVYFDLNKDEQFTFKIENGKTVRQPYAGKVDRATSSTVVKVPLGDAMEAVLGATESKEKGAKWGIAGEAYNAAIPMIDKLGQVKASLSSTFTGTGADAKLAFAKGLSALGIPVDSTKISNAEYFNSVSSQLVQAIASVFPGSQSNKELEQLLKSKPNAYQEIPTIVRLIGQLQDEMIASTKTYEQLDALGVKGRSTANPQIIQGKIYTKLRRYRVLEAQAASGKGMKQADIDEAKKLQQELGVQ